MTTADRRPAGADQDPTTGRFQPGNRVRVTHGGRSQVERAKVRRELVATMQELIAGQLPEAERSMPGTGLLVDMAAVQAADVRQLRDYVDEQGGPISSRGQLRKCLEMLRGRERDLLGTLDRLGCGARARAAIMGSLGQAGAAMRQALEADAAQARLRAKVASATPGNGHAGRLAASEVAE
jgi:hypothetical protein